MFTWKCTFVRQFTLFQWNWIFKAYFVGEGEIFFSEGRLRRICRLFSNFFFHGHVSAWVGVCKNAVWNEIILALNFWTFTRLFFCGRVRTFSPHSRSSASIFSYSYYFSVSDDTSCYSSVGCFLFYIQICRRKFILLRVNFNFIYSDVYHS